MGVLVEERSGWYRLTISTSRFSSDALAKGLATLFDNAQLDGELDEAFRGLQEEDPS
jgi:hypothetical protein